VPVVCDRCGFEGEKEQFEHIGNVMCCGPLVFKRCPLCGEPVICDLQEMRGEMEDAAREVSMGIEAAIQESDAARARELLDQLYCINKSLNLDPIRAYVRASSKRINRISGAQPS